MNHLETLNNVQVATPVVGGLEAAVGNTPLLPLRRVGAHLPPGVQVFAKAEWFNPGGSVKDRPALNILRTAPGERRAGARQAPARFDLRQHGHRLRHLWRGAGRAGDAGDAGQRQPGAHRHPARPGRRAGADRSAGRLGWRASAWRASMAAEQPERYFYANQYDNPANWQAHYLTTGPEIVQQTAGQVTHFVAGLGTSGTLTGVGRYLRQYNPDIQLVAVQPDSPFHGLEGLKHMPTAIQPGIFDPALPDRTLEITTEEAYEMVRRLAREEGLFVGISSGAAAAAALQVAEELEEGVVVTVFPDAGYKYLSEKRCGRVERKMSLHLSQNY